MSLHSSRLTQDQNFSVHFDGIKMNGSTVQKKKSGLGGRKALNDISNSGKPSAFQPSKKHNTYNVIPIGEDLSVTKKMNVSVGGKGKISGRKALGDLTNSVKQPFFNQQQSLKKKSLVKQTIPVVEDENVPYSIAEEGFLHNHAECIKSQNKSIDLDEFLKIIGLDEDASFESASAHNLLPKITEDENSVMLFDIDEICEPVIEDRLRGGHCSPICGSPDSARISYMVDMKDYDNFTSFVLSESPKRS